MSLRMGGPLQFTKKWFELRILTSARLKQLEAG
jgi:hypothetical protein